MYSDHTQPTPIMILSQICLSSMEGQQFYYTFMASVASYNTWRNI